MGTRGSAESNGADQNVLSYEILHAVKRDGLLVYSLGPWWNYRSWRRHFARTWRPARQCRGPWRLM